MLCSIRHEKGFPGKRCAVRSATTRSTAAAQRPQAARPKVPCIDGDGERGRRGRDSQEWRRTMCRGVAVRRNASRRRVPRFSQRHGRVRRAGDARAASAPAPKLVRFGVQRRGMRRSPSTRRVHRLATLAIRLDASTWRMRRAQGAPGGALNWKTFRLSPGFTAFGCASLRLRSAGARENRVMGPFVMIPVQCSSEDFEALEEVWRRRVESARDQYVEALSQMAQRRNRLARREALDRYRRVLRYFTELVMKGKIPPEGE